MEIPEKYKQLWAIFKPGLASGLSFILTPIYLSHIPILLFLVYMYRNGFFSYDFYTEGMFGLKVFFFLVVLILLALGVLLFWFVIPIIEWWVSKTISWGHLAVAAVVNVIGWGFVILVVGVWEKPLLFTYMFMLALLITGHVGMLIYAKPMWKLKSLLALIVSTLIMAVVLTETTRFISGGLRAYGVGGMIPIKIKETYTDDISYEGKLLLLSPKHIYMKLESSDENIILDRARFGVVSVLPPTKGTRRNKKDMKDNSQKSS